MPREQEEIVHIYAFSFGIADMGSAIPNVAKDCRTALTITRLVTAIATYQYVRIYNSWVEDFEVKDSQGGIVIGILSWASASWKSAKEENGLLANCVRQVRG